MTDWTVGNLDGFTAPAYRAMTFPRFRPLLEQLGPGSPVVGLGARRGEQPLGLALAEIGPGHGVAEILSLFVSPADRSRGVGASLLAGLEQELVGRGCAEARIVYMTGKATTAALERLLARAAWSAPSVRMLVGRGDRKMLQAPWMSGYRLPADYTVLPWGELPAEARSALVESVARSGRDAFALFADSGEPLEPITSLALRRRGETVGWFLTHRLAPDTVRYTSQWVREDCRASGCAVGLLAAAIRRQVAALGLDSRVVFAVRVENRPMVRFLERRLRPYLAALVETRGSSKALGRQPEASTRAGEIRPRGES
jgi:ribosomal protein S18 acetylase RimI-like enzyme